jgi:hypothetical protein
MFFVQPLVRGWARYKRRLLATQPRTSAPHVLGKDVALAANSVCFWSRRVERYAFIDAVQREIAKCAWPHRIDSGWDEFDLEISTNRWSIAELTTVHEELAEGRRFFRCRIETRSSWTSRLLAIMLAVASVFAVVHWRGQFPYVWFAVALIPTALLAVACAERAQQDSIASLVQAIAHALGLEEWRSESQVAERQNPDGGAGLIAGRQTAPR